ncbi:hypothetical protein AVEN_209173-1 [Araneus ventricosus]|uniref:Uncharacterized protein n=1 Tax=Araneus ventricosus TaxID=182803 RepID=A0A4Y2JSF0_ARAVE|nr:hypothetical protein AVEN_66798-1 [Araneus ventricosus]GBM92748.1 hypothetical protein AVEN_209173-1 [Araneus ventricosus]
MKCKTDPSTRRRKTKDFVLELRMKPYYDPDEQTEILDNSTPSIELNSRGSISIPDNPPSSRVHTGPMTCSRTIVLMRNT